MEEKILYEQKPSKRVLLFWISVPLLGIIIYYLTSSYYIYSVYLQYPKAYPNFQYAFIPSTTFLLVTIGIMATLSIYFYYCWKMYHYKITNQGVHFQGGVTRKFNQFVSFDKITKIAVVQSFLERPFGTKSLLIQTAGTRGMHSEITFIGLTDIETPRQLIYRFMEQKKKSAKYDE